MCSFDRYFIVYYQLSLSLFSCVYSIDSYSSDLTRGLNMILVGYRLHYCILLITVSVSVLETSTYVAIDFEESPTTQCTRV